MNTTFKSRPLFRAAAAALLMVGLNGVAGCTARDDNSDIRVARQPIPKQVRFRHDVAFLPNGAAVTEAERKRLQKFIAGIDPAYGDSIVIAAAANSNLSDRRSRSIAKALGDPGVPVYQRDVAALAGQSPHTLTVIVRRYTVVLPDCPDWSDNWKWTFKNQPHSNWSCATATNLGLMVADPADLVRGRDLTPGDGSRLAGSISRYRKDETKPLLGNAVSDVSAIQSGGK